MGRKTIAVPLHLEGISTPSENPDAGFKYIYFKADGILYCKDENGNEKVLGGGGGASSMILSFTNNTGPYVETTSGSYTAIAKFIFAGTDTVGTILDINMNIWLTGSGTGDVRIQDITNGLTLAEKNGFSNMNEDAIINCGAISNQPTAPAVIEIQAKKITGGGGAKVRVSTLEIVY